MAKKKGIPFDRILDLHNQGYYDEEIAAILGCARSNITKRLNQKGYGKGHKKRDDIRARNKISNTLKGRYVGDKNPHYKGYHDEKRIARGLFKTQSHEVIRNSNYRCAICGQHSHAFHVHHIKPFSIIFDEFIQTTYSGNIDTFVNEISQYPDFQNMDNLVLVCPDCHRAIHYTDNPELNPYRWGSATTIENP